LILKLRWCTLKIQLLLTLQGKIHKTLRLSWE
jgi:hypothetical protein